MVELSGQGLWLEAAAGQGGRIGWFSAKLGLTGALEAWLALPLVGGPSLSVSYTGMVLTFTYLWLPFMILPVSGGAGACAPASH